MMRTDSKMLDNGSCRDSRTSSERMVRVFGNPALKSRPFTSIVNSVSSGNADPILLAGGIGTALTTTFWGLVVAIPALAGYAIIRNRIDELTSLVEEAGA